MIGYLNGKLVALSPTQTFVDVNGIGYEVQLTLNTYEQIKDKESVLLYTHLQIREDAWVLYGFATEHEKEAFQKLLSVSGVGAATARVLLSSLTPDELARIVASGDSKSLEKVKGIGAKSAQRIILELKGKLLPGAVALTGVPAGQSKVNAVSDDALLALVGLGIPKANAEKAVRKSLESLSEDVSVEELIKTALKNI